ncbi:tripartite tricarboxylate transporter TctB family protein [Thetidibacter halocola]|uniref:Tripartite tricarboxylate transporter TctB family protein n=1 Tax=Thetidibacter halocola TaxID=2827239 RepID=A0A8J8BAB2_9RHOB|nr:tripartite tricarboxylate transporter TctB family protein [Thetidibacter halocola]MBS0126724.1 tripartite tricarboxylate transporter TctB family protein [Thetidibacter halocola]
MQKIDPDHHDGTSDATPGGEADKRRPGELAFALFLLGASAILLWNAYGIAGFEALSSPGAIPMATTAVMVVTAAMVALKTLRMPLDSTETLRRDILPLTVIVFAVLLVAYGLFLRTLGFLPVSAIFLIVAVKYLGRRSWGWTLGVSLAALAITWLIFRIVFSVLMPAGIVPEAEMVQALRSLFQGGAQ